MVVDPATGAVTYTANAGFIGTDTFTYLASDGNGGSDSGQVTVTVTPTADAPVATDDTATPYITRSLQTITHVSVSIGRDLSDKYLGDWRLFCEPMLKRVAGEIHGNLSGIQAKLAINVAFAVAKAGCMCCCAVVNLLLPLLTNRAVDTKNIVAASLSRSLLAERKGFSVLPSLTNSESVMPTAVEMLSQLIMCCADRNEGGKKTTSLRRMRPMLLQ